jgi:protein subunit release factor B
LKKAEAQSAADTETKGIAEGQRIAVYDKKRYKKSNDLRRGLSN